MERQLTDELVNAAIRRTSDSFRRFRKARRKGYFTEEEFFRVMLNSFHEGFWGLLRDRRMVLHLKDANFPRFSEDCRAFAGGGEPRAPEAEPWLYCGEVRPGREASAEDVKQVLALMNAFRLPPGFFEPLPEDVPAPDRVHVHQWHDAEAYGILFRCADDGGLSAEAEPVGKTFRLADERGLKAVVTVREDRRTGDRAGMDFDEIVRDSKHGPVVLLADLLAEGTIEGYTAIAGRESPEILIRFGSDNRPDRLAYYELPEDRRAFEAFPLWQEYFRLSQERERRQRDVLSALFASDLSPDDPC